MIRVGLVDDHPLMLDSLGRAVEAAEGLALVGAARDVAAAAQLIEGAELDVLVCDVQIGREAEGLRLLERYGRRPRPAFLMLSAFDYPALFRTAFERGAMGFLLKTSETEAVVAAIHTVAGGGTAFTAASMRVIQTALRRPSEREIEVIELVAGGAANDEIARRLVVSLKTVESHLRRLFDRYGVMNRTELAVLALREGWISSGNT
jgi:DNA-binding NarL/FixJ family response regulator